MINIPIQMNFKPYAYGFQKYSPFLGIFNYYIHEMKEKGMFSSYIINFLNLFGKVTASP